MLQNNSVRENQQISESTFGTSTKLGFTQSYNLDADGFLFASTQTGVAVNLGFSQEFGFTTSHRSQFTNTSKQETQRQLAQARTTTNEITATETVVRTVDGARIDTTIDLSNLSNLAYRITNLQVTALMTDPRDPTSLVPVATLVPENEPAEGFVLGPLAAARGPILMTSQTVFPTLVESLMENPQGLIFQISNFDIIDERGRNFAFSSQNIVERTGKLTLDFGGALSPSDELQPSTRSVEVHRVATSAGRVIGGVRTAYGPDGKEAGVTLREALAAVGLTGYQVRFEAGQFQRDANGKVLHFDAAGNQVTLTPEQIHNSYATYQKTIPGIGLVERFFRVREQAIEAGRPEAWEVITDTGIDPTLGPDTVILKAGSTATLAFVRDMDGDFLPSGLEDFHGSSDTQKDTDGDGLDDRFETLIGWDVPIPGRGLVHVTTSPTRADTDGDGLSDRAEAPAAWFDQDGDGLIDRGELTSDFRIFKFVNLHAFRDVNGNGMVDEGEPASILKELQPPFPTRDGDGYVISANPQLAIDGLSASDANRDGKLNVKEFLVGGILRVEVFDAGEYTDYVTNPLDADTDRDLLGDREEVTGVEIRPIDAPDTPILAATNPARAGSDFDGVIDGLEKLFGLNPADGLDRDSDADGLPDRVEQFGWGLSYEMVTDTPLEVKPGGQYSTGTVRVQSSTSKADTDGDGLTDLEEYRLKTLPADLFPDSPLLRHRGIDSDNDGISDFDEVRGFKLSAGRDQTPITLNPLDADLDNDGLSDGEEAEIDLDTNGRRVDRGFAGRWIVSVIGEVPRRGRFRKPESHGVRNRSPHSHHVFF